MVPAAVQREVQDLVAKAVKTAELCAERAWQTKAITSSIYTRFPNFYYCHPEKKAAAISIIGHSHPSQRAVTVLKKAFGKVYGGDDEYLIADGWIKVGYSPTLRRTGELLNFFPGHYPGGFRNNPNPLMAMLTSGLLGAGLGYGTGWAGRKMLGWKDPKLERNAALLGGLIGASPGALWAVTNAMSGKPVNSPRPFWFEPHTRPYGASNVRNRAIPKWDPKKDPFRKASRPKPRASAATPSETAKWLSKSSAAIDVELHPFYKAAVDKIAMLPGTGVGGGGPPLLNTDALGRTLWNVPGLPGETKQTTMAAVQTAKHFPGGPGPSSPYVTFDQMGNMAMGMGVGYGKGALVGKALGVLTGMPESTQNLLARTGMYAGLVNAVVPKLFGG